MSKRRQSLMEFMEDRKLVRRGSAVPLEEFRRQVENGALLRDMESAAQRINDAAGSLLIDVQSYLWPEPLVRSFSLHRNGEEYSMQLELWSDGLVLTFLSRKGKGIRILNRILPWMMAQWAGLHEINIVVKSSSPLQPDLVSARDIESWFMYLLSAFDGSHAPTLPKDHPDAREARGVLGGVGRRGNLAVDEIS